jgi:hypothetical protein
MISGGQHRFGQIFEQRGEEEDGHDREDRCDER